MRRCGLLLAVGLTVMSWMAPVPGWGAGRARAWGERAPGAEAGQGTRVLPAARTRADEAFVHVEGSELVLDGQPFHFVGANAAVLHSVRHREALAATLDDAVADGARVVRIWALGETSPSHEPEPWREAYAFRLGPEGWLESSFAALDEALVAAAERGLRVVVVLANRWGDYGGVRSYLDWVGRPSAARHPSEGELGDFIASADTRALYRAHLERVVSRTNALTGVAYRDDPTVMAWELINEVSAHGAAVEPLVEWVREHAALVHRLAPRQLVSAGHIGFATRDERETWRRVMALPEVDYADAHAYPASDARVLRPAQLRPWVSERVRLATMLGKPLVFGEVGFRLDGRGLGPRTRGWGERTRGSAARWTRAFLTAARREGAAGVLWWSYLPSGEPSPYGLRSDAPAHGGGVRRALRAAARASWSRPRVAARDDAPPARLTWRGSGRVASWRASSRGLRARWALDELRRARFESVGRAAAGDQEGAPAHVWGASSGYVEFALRALPQTPRVLRVRLRASTELPGDGAGLRVDTAVDAGAATHDDARERAGRARVSLAGVLLGELPLPADDGRGAELELVVRDPAQLRRLPTSGGVRTLRLEVETGGLCVYAGTPIELVLE